MKKYRKRLPPLDTLIFFECAFRRGSFTEAAEELFVSQAAVSKRIRQLEDWLRTPLFERHPQKLIPTGAAERLGDRVAMALEFLDQTVTRARSPAQPVVRIASMTAVGMFWLQPRLRSFSLSDEACIFNLTLADDLTSLLSAGNDLVVVYGEGVFPGWSALPVLSESLTAVAAPEVSRRLTGAGKLADPAAPLLDYERLAPNWIDWSVWAERMRLPPLCDMPRMLCSSYAQSVGRALDGRGVALGSMPLLGDELATGRLARLDQPTYESPRSYWLAWPSDRHLTAEAQRLRDALCVG